MDTGVSDAHASSIFKAEALGPGVTLDDYVDSNMYTSATIFRTIQYQNLQHPRREDLKTEHPKN
jgi:hypothetical protein